MMREISAIVSLSATVSPTPMLEPVVSSQWLMIFWCCPRKARAAPGPYSRKATCTMPPAVAPSVFLSRMPVSNSPATICTAVSETENHLCSSEVLVDDLRVRLMLGK